MSRIFRCDQQYASVEVGVSLACITVEGTVHVTHAYNCRNVVECQRTLKNITGKGEWKWVA